MKPVIKALRAVYKQLLILSACKNKNEILKYCYKTKDNRHVLVTKRVNYYVI